jgi:hypothetical protein
MRGGARHKNAIPYILIRSQDRAQAGGDLGQEHRGSQHTEKIRARRSNIVNYSRKASYHRQDNQITICNIPAKRM